MNIMRFAKHSLNAPLDEKTMLDQSWKNKIFYGMLIWTCIALAFFPSLIETISDIVVKNDIKAMIFSLGLLSMFWVVLLVMSQSNYGDLHIRLSPKQCTELLELVERFPEAAKYRELVLQQGRQFRYSDLAFLQQAMREISQKRACLKLHGADGAPT